MWISEFSLTNYKSFRETGSLTLKPGFNIVVGPNNAGKTALLEGITMRYSAIPHRSTRIHRTATSPDNPTSRADATIVTTGTEVRDTILAAGKQEFLLPVPSGAPHSAGNELIDGSL